jgi:probable addiction module antidote protein
MTTKSQEKIRRLTDDYEQWLVNSLKDKEDAALYLQVALDEYQLDGNKDALMLALRHVAEAQGGVSRLSKRTQLNRESLYKTLSKKGNPTLSTLGILLKELGFYLTIKPLRRKAA